MIELTLVTLALLFVVFVVKPGRTPPLANPLVINRLGHYHIMLAPQLNLAQPLIEDIAKRLGKPDDPTLSSATLCFSVRDDEVTAHGQKSYLLAVTQRNGMLYFQAMTSQANEAQLQIQELLGFADKVLLTIPNPDVANEQLGTRILAAVQDVAQQHKATITPL